MVSHETRFQIGQHTLDRWKGSEHGDGCVNLLLVFAFHESVSVSLELFWRASFESCRKHTLAETFWRHFRILCCTFLLRFCMA